MSEDVTGLLLNGMPINIFLVYYFYGIVGILMFYLGSAWKAMNSDTTTPSTFSWRLFFKGAIRVVLSVITLFFIIIYFKDFSPFIFNLPEGSDKVEINGFSSLFSGIGIDSTWKFILGISKGSSDSIKRKVNK